MALAAPFPTVRSARPSATRPSARSSRPAQVRLTARGRVVLFVGSVLALTGAVIASGQLADAGTAAAGGPATAVVVVQAGDSLWSIAQRVAPAADPRETVIRLRELNGMGDAVVVPGQSLVVPRA